MNNLLVMFSATQAYGGSTTYHLVETAMTWDAAFGYCARIGGHLAVINDATEFNATERMLEAYKAGGASERMWVDGTDQVVYGRWMCESLNAPCPYLGWHSGQPNNPAEKCIAIYPGLWTGLADAPCDMEGVVMCEFECYNAVTNVGL